MTATWKTSSGLGTSLVNGVLAIKPLADFAKHQARQMMINRAEKIGVPWRQEVESLRSLDWEAQLAQVQNPQVQYPEYYLRSFHAYEQGNLNWDAALEFEVAAKAVHAAIWPEAKGQGDAKLRQSYLELIRDRLPQVPQTILDAGCGAGLSTFTLQNLYPQAQITALDLSPYFLAVGKYKAQQQNLNSIQWLHAAAENTGLPDASFDLIAIILVFHELPQLAAQPILQEMRRLLRPNGFLAIMDMNPNSEIVAKMPPYVFTLLKSTEPYLDEYFSLDLESAIQAAGFNTPTVTFNSPRHRTFIAQAV